MTVRAMFFLLLISTMSAHAATIVFGYDAKTGKQTGAIAVTGIHQESSWSCRGNTDTLCPCSQALYSGRIAQVEYRLGTSTPEGIVLETKTFATHINLGADWTDRLSNAEASWIGGVIKRDERVLVAAEVCGASGGVVIARDIYGHRLLDEIKK